MNIGSKMFEDLARSIDGGAGIFSGIKREVEMLVQEKLRHHLLDMELVTREEFEIVKGMATKAREENQALQKQIDVLNKKLDQ